MAANYKLEVITPQGAVYSEEVEHVRLPTTNNGSIGVLGNHASLITASDGGLCLIREKGGKEKNFEVGAGFFSVNQNTASFLTQVFEEK